MTASKRYLAMLSGKQWSEASTHEDGLYHTNSDGFDAEAFFIVLNAIHLRFRQVPRIMDLETMAKVAVVIDYYEVEEAMEYVIGNWITSLRVLYPVPTTYCRNLLLWILVARVCGLRDEFEEATKIARVITRSEPSISPSGRKFLVCSASRQSEKVLTQYR